MIIRHSRVPNLSGRSGVVAWVAVPLSRHNKGPGPRDGSVRNGCAVHGLFSGLLRTQPPSQKEPHSSCMTERRPPPISRPARAGLWRREPNGGTVPSRQELLIRECVALASRVAGRSVDTVIRGRLAFEGVCLICDVAAGCRTLAWIRCRHHRSRADGAGAGTGSTSAEIIHLEHCTADLCGVQLIARSAADAHVLASGTDRYICRAAADR